MKYPIIEQILATASTIVESKLLSKKIKSATQADIETLDGLEKELASLSRKMGRVVKSLENYVVVPTKIHLMSSELSLYSHEISNQKSKLKEEVARKEMPHE